MPIYDFECKCGNIEKDVLTDKVVSHIKCSKCGKLMKKIPSITGGRFRFMDTLGCSKKAR